MTDSELFNLFFNGGNYSRHYLIKLTHATAGTLRLVNDVDDYELDGETFNASTFDYNPPDNTGAGGALAITSIENNLIEFLENADENYRLDVIGVINKNGSLTRYKTYTHFYGSISYGEDYSVNFSLGSDDRQDLSFTPYTYDTDNNRGNA